MTRTTTADTIVIKKRELKALLREVVRDLPDEDSDNFNEPERIETFCKIIDKIKKCDPNVERINAEVVRIVQSADVQQRLRSEAFEVPADTPDQFAAVIRAEIAKWANVVKEAGIRAN